MRTHHSCTQPVVVARGRHYECCVMGWRSVRWLCLNCQATQLLCGLWGSAVKVSCWYGMLEAKHGMLRIDSKLGIYYNYWHCTLHWPALISWSDYKDHYCWYIIKIIWQLLPHNHTYWGSCWDFLAVEAHNQILISMSYSSTGVWTASPQLHVSRTWHSNPFNCHTPITRKL